jgi:tetratricopeptide (TPR) repeat protein
MKKKLLFDPEESNLEDILNEEFNDFADFSEKMPTVSLGRNDSCLCGSGKKYKKCCLEKEKNLSPLEVISETFHIKFDALTPEESKNNFPAFSEDDKELISTIYEIFSEHPETIDSENCDYFRQVRMLQTRYSDHPLLLNYLANGYQQLGMSDQLDAIIMEMYKKFPDYLFAQTGLANCYLRDGLIEKAKEVLKNANTLKQLYPHRDVFHVSEVKTFEFFMVRYCCETDDKEQAEIHLQIMEKVLDEDDMQLHQARKMVRKSKIVCEKFYHRGTEITENEGRKTKDEDT